MTASFIKGLLLLSLTLVVWTLPIDRPAEPPQQEKVEENAVSLVFKYTSRQEFVGLLIHFCHMFHRIPVCTMIAT